MRRQKSLYILFIAIIIACLPAVPINAQLNKIQFNHLNTSNGLSNNLVTCLLQDSKGFLWIGTDDGLNKFDGHKIIVYKHLDRDSNSLCASKINCLYEDNAHNIWVGTTNGLSITSNNGLKFTNFYSKLNSANSLPHPYIQNIFNNHKGNIIVSTRTGLVSYDEVHHNFNKVHFAFEDSMLRADGLTANFIIDSAGRWIIGATKGIAISTDAGKTFAIYKNVLSAPNFTTSPPDVTSFYEVNGYLFFGYWNIPGIYRFNLTTHLFTKYTINMEDGKLPREVPFGFLLVDSSKLWAGGIWGGNSNDFGGLFEINLINGEVQRLRYDPLNKQSISSKQIMSILQTRDHTIWIATDHGIDYYNEQLKEFENIDYTQNFREKNNDKIISLISAFDSTKWIGTFGNGIYLFNAATGKSIHYLLPVSSSNNNLNNTIWGICPDQKNQKLWIGVQHGLMQFDIKTKRFITNLSLPDSVGFLKNITTSNVFHDSQNNFWFGTSREGIVCFNTKQKIFVHYSKSSKSIATRLPWNYTSSIDEDSLHNLWIGFFGFPGLCSINTITGKIKTAIDSTLTAHIDFNKQDNIYDNENTLCVHCSKDLYVWFGTVFNGIARYDIKTGKFTHYKTTEGLIDDYVTNITEDSKHHLWIATEKGLSCLEWPQIQFENFTVANGLPDDDLSESVFAKWNDKIIISQKNLLLVFNPYKLLQSKLTPILAFTSFKKNEEEFYNLNDSVFKISPKENFISFEYTSINFIDPYYDQFAYKLDGFDKKWIYSNDRRYASYTNLKGGNYTFKVKASNNSGLWSVPISLFINVSPPFYDTWWFIALCVLVIFGVAYFVLYLRQLQALQILHIRNRIARDLHDDVGSALSSIAVFSDVINKNLKNGDEQTSSLATRIGANARQVIESMSDIIWAVKPTNETVAEMLIRMKQLCSNVFESKEIAFQFETDEKVSSIKLPMNYRRDMYLIFKEAVNNIVKYAECKNVIIKMFAKDSLFQLLISDDGIGFDTATTTNGNGLQNMKARSAAMQGSISFESKLNEGTIIQLVVPIP